MQCTDDLNGACPVWDGQGRLPVPQVEATSEEMRAGVLAAARETAEKRRSRVEHGGSGENDREGSTDGIFGAHGRKPTPGATRYGEAENPGPVQSRISLGPVTYKAPHKPGFHGALMRDTEGEEAAMRPDGEMAGLRVETCNATSWGSLRRYLRRTKAEVILAQEHHLGPLEVPAKSSWALRTGWHSVFAPAAPGEGQGWKAGVAIFARPHLGLSLPRVGSHIVVPHRAVAACVEPPGHRLTTLVSLYLEDGKGIGKENLEHIAAVGNFIGYQGADVPYIIGGDWQCKPEDLATTGFACQTGGEIISSACPRGTCRSSRKASEIDYFVVHRMMAVGIQQVKTVEDARTRPHVPVAVEFMPRLVAARTLVLRMPPKISTERVFGPLPPPPNWAEVKDGIMGLVRETRKDNFVIGDAFRDKCEEMYQLWSDLAEVEIEGASADALPLPKKGTRGRRPELKWRSVLPELPLKDLTTTGD